MGLCLRRVVLQYPRLGWQGSTGIHGSFQSESVATFDRIQWQDSTGISGNLRPEYAVDRGQQEARWAVERASRAWVAGLAGHKQEEGRIHRLALPLAARATRRLALHPDTGRQPRPIGGRTIRIRR